MLLSTEGIYDQQKQKQVPAFIHLLRPSVVSRPLAEKLLSVYRMKLRIRCNKTTKVFAVSDERNELTTLSEVREAASGLFNIG